MYTELRGELSANIFRSFTLLITIHLLLTVGRGAGATNQLQRKRKLPSSESRDKRPRFVRQIDHLGWTEAAEVHFLSKRWVVSVHSGSMASSSNSHNLLLWERVLERRPCATETVEKRRQRGWWGRQGGLQSSWYQFFILFSLFPSPPLSRFL